MRSRAHVGDVHMRPALSPVSAYLVAIVRVMWTTVAATYTDYDALSDAPVVHFYPELANSRPVTGLDADELHEIRCVDCRTVPKAAAYDIGGKRYGPAATASENAYEKAPPQPPHFERRPPHMEFCKKRDHINERPAIARERSESVTVADRVIAASM